MMQPWRGHTAIAILLFGGLGLPPATAMAHGVRSQGTYVTTDPVNVRAGPHEGHEVLRTFRKGTTFEIVGKEGAWLKVKMAEHEERFGYVDGRFAVLKDQQVRINSRTPALVSTKDQKSRIPPRPAVPGTYLTTKPVEVRAGPGKDYSILSTIPKGTRIVIVAMDGEWLRIAQKRGEPPAFVERGITFVEPVD